jgi:hypothetical protein
MRLAPCAGAAGALGQQRALLTRLEHGRYAADRVVDYLQNKPGKALLLTERHVIYVNLRRGACRWAFSLANLFSVSTQGKAQICSLCPPRVGPEPQHHFHPG